MKAFLIVAILAILSGGFKAVRDTVAHHYTVSVFKKWGNETYWNPEVSWKAKYKDYDNGDTRPAFPLAKTLLVSLTDAWHLFDLLHRLALIAAGIMGGIYAHRKYGKGWLYWLGAWRWAIVIFIAGGAAFHLLYTYILVYEGTV